MSQHSAPIPDDDFDSFVHCAHSSTASECFSDVGDEDETWAMPAPPPPRGDNAAGEVQTRQGDESTSGREQNRAEIPEGSRRTGGEQDSGEVQRLKQEVNELQAQLDLAKLEKQQDEGVMQQVMLYFQRERDSLQVQLVAALAGAHAGEQWENLARHLQQRLGETENGLRATTSELEGARCGIAALEAARDYCAADLEAACDAAEAGWEELNAAQDQLDSARLEAVHAQDAADHATEETRRLTGELRTVQESLLQAQKDLKEREEELEYIRSW